MGMGYLEVRKNTARGNSISTDMMRHLHARQYLGKAVIAGQQPIALLSAARKQWLKLSRYVQKQRAATLDADKILKYTHTVTHMQHMRFTAKAPLDAPDADVYFIDPKNLAALPPDCRSVYLTISLSSAQTNAMCRALPDTCLVVDYADNLHLEANLEPKHQLEVHVSQAWQVMEAFLIECHIDVHQLSENPVQNMEAMEEALDILLGKSHRFLQIASDFQHALELARPLRLHKTVRQRYDAAVLLAHRVQALSTAGFTGQFLETYNEDDTFFLYDSSSESAAFGRENTAAAIVRNQAAGRLRLADALQTKLGLRHELLAKAQTM